MASNGAGFSESLVHASASTQGKYSYRSGMGMVPSAEWMVFFDDFNELVTTNVPDGWAAAIIDAGGTVIQHTTAAGHPGTGVIALADATASEGAAIYLPRSIQLISGKKFMMECRVFTDDVTDNAVQFGLTDLTAVTNPEDLWTTTAANVAAFGILDGSAVTQFLVDENNGGTAAVAGTRSLTASTWHVLGISYNGGVMSAWVDGKLSASTSTAADIPTDDVLLAPFIGHINGNGAGGNVVLCDWFRVVVER
jgi:hypothetical protein